MKTKINSDELTPKIIKKYRIYVQNIKRPTHQHPRRIAKMMSFDINKMLLQAIKSFPHLSDGRKWFVIEELSPTPLTERKLRGKKVEKMMSKVIKSDNQIGIMFSDGKIKTY